MMEDAANSDHGREQNRGTSQTVPATTSTPAQDPSLKVDAGRVVDHHLAKGIAQSFPVSSASTLRKRLPLMTRRNGQHRKRPMRRFPMSPTLAP